VVNCRIVTNDQPTISTPQSNTQAPHKSRFRRKGFKGWPLTILLGVISGAIFTYGLVPLLTFLRNTGLDVATLGGTAGSRNELYKIVATGVPQEPLAAGVLLAWVAGTLVVTSMWPPRIIRRKLSTKRGRWQIYLARIVQIGILFWNIQFSVRASYIDSAVAHYRQLRTIIAPYSLPDQLALMDSYFARMRTAAEYRLMINGMTDIAKKSGLYVPPFEIW